MHTITNFRRKLDAFSSIPPNEFALFNQTLGTPKILEKGEELRFRHAGQQKAFLVSEGWAFTYRMLANGARQIVDIAVPGDIIGLRGLMLRSGDCKGTLLNVSAVHEINSNTLLKLFDETPRIGAGILWAGSRDEALLVERLTSVGRRPGAERVAHFFLELKARLELVGKCSGGTYACPLSQGQIADALGLTPAHLNRVLRHLREMNLIHIHHGEVEIIDEEQAALFAQFNGRYLDQNWMPPSALVPEQRASSARRPVRNSLAAKRGQSQGSV